MTIFEPYKEKDTLPGIILCHHPIIVLGADITCPVSPGRCILSGGSRIGHIVAGQGMPNTLHSTSDVCQIHRGRQYNLFGIIESGGHQHAAGPLRLCTTSTYVCGCSFQYRSPLAGDARADSGKMDCQSDMP